MSDSELKNEQCDGEEDELRASKDAAACEGEAGSSDSKGLCSPRKDGKGGAKEEGQNDARRPRFWTAEVI
jgi:hypothetical protein